MDGHLSHLPEANQDPVDMEQAFWEIEIKDNLIHREYDIDPDLKIKDIDEVNISDEEKNLKADLKRMGESAGICAKFAHERDKEFRVGGN